MCPLYVSGLIGPGEPQEQPMVERAARGDYDQLHHFIAVPNLGWAAESFRFSDLLALIRGRY